MIVAGVDIGSVAAKAVVFGDDNLFSSHVVPTGANCNIAAETALAEALKKVNVKKEDLAYIMATGYGRRAIDFGDGSITEITADAKGAVYLGSSMGKVRTIINVGGQDTKVIVLDDNGTISNFAMNDKCAAGTGRFLEVIARALEETIESFSTLSLQSKEPATINSTCTVFAESEVVSLVAQNIPKKDIIAGIHKGVAKRISDMSIGAGAKDVVFFDGGGAKNVGLKTALEKELGRKVFVSKIPQFTVALGAAIFGYEKAKKLKAKEAKPVE
jgi:(R)-2-hydroxyacyl-CoA dehydratese activating ATPase